MHRPERWIPLLQKCESEADIVRTLRDFVRTIPPNDLAAIPARAGIATLESTVDLAGIAVSLAREELLFAGDEKSGAVFSNVTAVFAAAATRLAQIQSQRLSDPVA